MPDPEFQQLVASRLPQPPDPLADDTRLRDFGLDSIHSIDLLLAIEDRYDIEFPTELLGDATFDTLASLWSVVQRIRGEESHV